MKHLAKDKDSKVVEDAEEKVQSLLFTFNQHLRNKYDRYYFVFVGCEASNLLIVIAQLLLTNSFLGRELEIFSSLVHSHWSRNVEARLSLVDIGSLLALRWFFMA